MPLAVARTSYTKDLLGVCNERVVRYLYAHVRTCYLAKYITCVYMPFRYARLHIAFDFCVFFTDSAGGAGIIDDYNLRLNL
jgi:hypothetical protein